jgi:hypothetical protein
MLGQLKGLAPSVIGAIGAGLGLAYSSFLVSNYGDGCSCDWSIMQVFLGRPMLVGSVLGLGACGLYLVIRRVAGVFFLAGGVLASPIPFFVAIGSWPDPGLVLSIWGVLLAPSLFAGLLLFLSGLMSFPKTRHILKNLHDGGWIP